MNDKCCIYKPGYKAVVHALEKRAARGLPEKEEACKTTGERLGG